MYDLRAVLEGYAARRAATRVTAEQLDELRASCDRFATLVGGDDLPALVAENAVFHETILAAAGERAPEPRWSARSSPCRSSTSRTSGTRPAQASASHHYHLQLVKALERGDGERAELVMREHVFEARDVLVQHMDAELAERGRGPERAAKA